MRLAGEIRLQASFVFWGVVATAHLAALSLLFFPGVMRAALIPGVSVVALSAVFACRQWRSSKHLVFVLSDEGAISVRDSGGHEHLVSVEPGTRDGGFFVLLCWRDLASKRKARLCLTRSQMTPGEWRLLRGWLRWRVLSPVLSSAADRAASADS